MIEKEAEAEKVDGVKKGTTSRGKVRFPFRFGASSDAHKTMIETCD
jgi:hypothetical protein